MTVQFLSLLPSTYTPAPFPMVLKLQTKVHQNQRHLPERASQLSVKVNPLQLKIINPIYLLKFGDVFGKQCLPILPISSP